jgi:hypothetical protein
MQDRRSAAGRARSGRTVSVSSLVTGACEHPPWTPRDSCATGGRLPLARRWLAALPRPRRNRISVGSGGRADRIPRCDRSGWYRGGGDVRWRTFLGRCGSRWPANWPSESGLFTAFGAGSSRATFNLTDPEHISSSASADAWFAESADRGLRAEFPRAGHVSRRSHGVVSGRPEGVSPPRLMTDWPSAWVPNLIATRPRPRRLDSSRNWTTSTTRKDP